MDFKQVVDICDLRDSIAPFEDIEWDALQIIVNAYSVKNNIEVTYDMLVNAIIEYISNDPAACQNLIPMLSQRAKLNNIVRFAEHAKYTKIGDLVFPNAPYSWGKIIENNKIKFTYFNYKEEWNCLQFIITHNRDGCLVSITMHKKIDIQDDLFNHGVHKFWYEHGQPKSEYHYKNGLCDGLCKEWDENRQLRSIQHHKDGVLVSIEKE